MNSLWIKDLAIGEVAYVGCGNREYKIWKSGVKMFSVTGGWCKDDEYVFDDMWSINYSAGVSVRNKIIVGCNFRFDLWDNGGYIIENDPVISIEVKPDGN